jgi:protein-S-isoprenylcysteine O-methyltransferase Ste14
VLHRLFAFLRGLVYATGFVALWWWVVSSARALDSRVGVAIPGWAQGVGLVLVVLGAAMALSCVIAFALVGRGTPAPFDAPREFVAVGPYRFVRNPMYLGAAAVIAGAGLMLRSPAAVGVAVVFVAVTHAFVLLYEEPTLERRFGESYRRYRSSVGRWLPRRPRPG